MARGLALTCTVANKRRPLAHRAIRRPCVRAKGGNASGSSKNLSGFSQSKCFGGVVHGFRVNRLVSRAGVTIHDVSFCLLFAFTCFRPAYVHSMGYCLRYGQAVHPIQTTFWPKRKQKSPRMSRGNRFANLGRLAGCAARRCNTLHIHHFGTLTFRCLDACLSSLLVLRPRASASLTMQIVQRLTSKKSLSSKIPLVCNTKAAPPKPPLHRTGKIERETGREKGKPLPAKAA